MVRAEQWRTLHRPTSILYTDRCQNRRCITTVTPTLHPQSLQYGGTERCCNPSVCPSVCLSHSRPQLDNGAFSLLFRTYETHFHHRGKLIDWVSLKFLLDTKYFNLDWVLSHWVHFIAHSLDLFMFICAYFVFFSYCIYVVLLSAQNSSDNLPSYLQTNTIAQMLSIRGEE